MLAPEMYLELEQTNLRRDLNESSQGKKGVLETYLPLLLSTSTLLSLLSFLSILVIIVVVVGSGSRLCETAEELSSFCSNGIDSRGPDLDTSVERSSCLLEVDT